MEKTLLPDPTTTPEVQSVVENLVRILNPASIYLYNRRVGPHGEITSFKLCVVAPVADKCEAERDAYLQIDSDIPYDILLYTPQEWEQLLGQGGSFASRIYHTGTALYG